MAKCVNCGENNNDKSIYCSHCGKPLGKGVAPAASQEINLDKARKEFAKDSLISLDREKITYVCELCGTINRIDSPRCVKCGKPRPRNEFINSLKRIKESDIAKEEFKKEEEQKEPVIQQPLPEEKKAEVLADTTEKPGSIQQTVYRFQPGAAAANKAASTTQTNSVVQPIVIVPYVNPAQPIWQYNAEPQIMRYNGPINDLSELQRLNKLKEEQQQKLLLEKEAQNIIPYEETIQEDPDLIKKKKKMRNGTVIALILALATIVGVAVFSVLVLFDKIELLKSDPSAWHLYLMFGGSLLVLVICVYILIRSILRLKNGENKSKGIIPALLTVAGALLVYFALIVEYFDGITNINLSDASALLDAPVPFFILLAAAILLLLASFFTKHHKVKKEQKA